MAEGVTARCGTKRKSFERGDADILLGPNKKCQSPVVITAPDGRTSTKTKSRLSFFATNTGHGNDQIKQQFISRINQAETLLSTKRVSSSRESLFGTICNSGFTTPRKLNLNPGETTPNPSSFMTPMNTGGRASLCERTPFQSQRPVTQQKSRVPMSGRKMKLRASVQLRTVESQEFQASQVARAKMEMWMDRQERAYSVWLTQLLKQPMDEHSKVLSAGSGAEIQSSVESFGRLSGSSIEFISSDSRERGCSREVISDLLQKPKPDEKNQRKMRTNSRLSSARHFRGLNEYKRTNPDEPETHLNQVCTASELRRRLGPYLAPSTSDRVISTMTQLAKNIDDGRLRMKPNCIVLSDVALRKKALDVLFSYTPAWLRLGLVVVLGPIALSNEKSLALNMAGCDGGDIDISMLEVLIEEHFFADSMLSKSFAANRLIDGLYRDGYKEALGKLILKRVFLLILVLDKMKCETALDSAHGIDGLDGGSPLLFIADGKVKSSRQALEDFLSNVMQGEGDLIIHVGKLGYHVSHIQAPLCEYNFEVVNLVVDLQDGIRLCRLAQLMSRDVSVLVDVRLPCHMPKKRVHNCEVALQSLALAGVPLLDDQESPIVAEHIAAGQRDKILSLMWNVILHLQLPRLLSHPKFWQEIEFSPGKIAMGPLRFEAEGYAVLDLLLTWVQAICSNFGAATVRNFSTCFADGRVLCYLISNYLPHCIPHHAIRSTMCSASYCVQSSGQHGRWKLPTNQMSGYMARDDREAIAHNFGMVQDVIKMFGNLPEVLELSDLVGGDICTSERNVIIFVAHLCSGLLKADPQRFHAVDVMNPTFAKAESKWGKPIPSHGDSADTAPVVYNAIHDWAAVQIQAWYKGRLQRRSFKRLKRSVTVLQRFIREWLAKKKTIPMYQMLRSPVSRGAVLKIQVTWRGHCIRKDMKAERGAAIQVQRCFRGYCQRRDFHACKTSSLHIQATVRGYLVRQRFQRLREGVLKIQSVWRGICVRRMTKRWKAAATQIERCYLTFCQRNLYKSQLTAIVQAQAFVRGHLRRRRFKALRRAVVRFQACWRGFRTRMMIQKMGAAVTQIQSSYRGYCSRKSYNLSKSWVLKVQALARRFLTRRRIDTCRTAVIIIQASWRAHVERRAFLKWKKAATEVQSNYRGYNQRKKFSLQKSITVRLQAVVRGKLIRKRITFIKQAALTIQACWRGFCARRNLLCSRDAAKRIQSSYRGYIQRKLYHKETTAVVTVQAIVRRELVRQRLSQCNKAASTIQAVWRGSHVRKLVQKWRSSATKIQSCFRRCVQRRTCRSVLQEVVNIQVVSGGGLHQKVSHMQMQKDHYRLAYEPVHCSETAASIIQAHWRVHCGRKHHPTLRTERTAEHCETDRDLTEVESSGRVYNMFELEAVRTITLWVISQKDRFKFLRLRRLAILIQGRFRGLKARNHYAHVKRSAALIQAHWRGYKWRKGQGRVKQHMQELRLRMQCTAASVDNSQRLGNRLLEALAQLLSQKTVSGILNTCATIDMATKHSKQCCEWLAEGGAICKLVQLIQTTNRSPPHEQVLKHALSILANLARYPSLAFRIAGEPDSISIINEQLLVFRNKEEVFSKAMKVLQHVCATPGCTDIIQKDAVVICRLQHVAQMLERKFQVEKRNLEKLPLSAHLPVRIAADQKLRETSRHHQSIATILPVLVSGKLTSNTGIQQLSGTVRPIAAAGLTSRNDNSSGNFAISITSDSRRNTNSHTTSRTKPFEDRKRGSLKSTTPLANTSHDRRRESVSSKPPWGKVPLQVGKALRQTPKLGIERKRDSITSPTSGLSDNRRQENIMSKAKVIQGRTKSTSDRPPWGKATIQPRKVSCEVRMSQSRLPPMPFRDLSNHVT